MREKELTFDERAVWGECPVCHAPDLTPCFADVGVQLGTHPDGSRMKDGEGAHLGRLQAAPKRTKVVAA